MKRLDIPPGPFEAYLFDCDGTIADSMPVHFRAWTQAVEEQGGTFPEALFYRWAGVPHDRIVELLNAELRLAMPIAETTRRKEELYVELLSDVKAIGSVVDHIEKESGRLPFAVVSGSPRVSVVKTLTILGLLHHFSVVVCAEDYRHGKPHPEPFLLAAQKLDIPPERCLVFEDADAGIRSAESAGMQWVRVPRSATSWQMRHHARDEKT